MRMRPMGKEQDNVERVRRLCEAAETSSGHGQTIKGDVLPELGFLGVVDDQEVDGAFVVEDVEAELLLDGVADGADIAGFVDALGGVGGDATNEDSARV